MADTLARNAAVESALATRATASRSTTYPAVPATLLTASHLTTEVGGIRSFARVLNDDVDDLHKRTHEDEWRTAAAERGKASVTSMLSELADLGFAWRDIARMVSVTVPAVQKWRKGREDLGG